MKKRNSVKCEACNGFGWTVAGAPAADWGTVCDVCRGRGSLSEYRIAKLCAGPWLELGVRSPAAWTKAALRDLRRPTRRRKLGPRRAFRLLGVLSALAAAVGS